MPESPPRSARARDLWQRARKVENALLERRPLAYAVAVVITVLAVLGRLSLDAAWGTTKPFMLFFPALMIVGRLGGFGPGVLATAMSTLAIDYFWTEPFGRFHLPEAKNLTSFVIFVASGVLVSALNGSLHASMRRARRLLETRETLLATVAHDLRNPLGSIGLSVSLLRRKAQSPEATDRALATIDRSVLRMDRLISDILDASRLEAGRVDIVLRDEPVTPLALEALEAHAPSASAKQIEVTSSVAADLPLIRCDRERVLQILGNLFGNAIKFTPGGGKIAFEVTRAGHFVQLRVSDSGPGIAPDDVAHVFDRYWKKGSGTGLGLYIVRGLVAAQGGRAWVESEVGRGASVFVALPIAE
jgi:signal transduction histidine kinase